MCKKELSLIIALVMLTGLLFVPINQGTVAAESTTIDIGDYIQFGMYNNKPILWKIINKDTGGNPMLFADKILSYKPFDAAESSTYGQAGGSYSFDVDRQKYGSNKWENSNLREWLNSSEQVVSYSTQSPTNIAVFNGHNDYANESGFLSNFTVSERNVIKPVTHKVLLADIDKGEKDGGSELYQYKSVISEVISNYDKSYYKNITDNVFLLDEKEIKEYLYDKGWEFIGHPIAEAILNDESGLGASVLNLGQYWLRSPYTLDSSSVRYTYSGGIAGSSYGDGKVNMADFVISK